jgi:hypothetical protein
MSRTIQRRIGTTILAGVLAIGTGLQTASADNTPDGAWVPGTESLPPAPTGKESERLQALHYQAPVDEMAGDISTTLVTHTVYARVTGDEEWRSFYGANWMSEAEARMEAADNAMFSQFGIDFVELNFWAWDSAPDSSRPICNTGLLEELVADVPRGSADVVVGYTNNTTSGTGCSVGNHTLVKLHGSTTASRIFNVWTTSQHEFSHLFGAPDRYPDPGNFHTNDVMENQYTNPDFWCTQTHYEDWSFLWANKAKYD